MSSYYSRYLSTYIKKTFEDLLDTDNLTNIILYSTKTSGKTLKAHYISYRYYEKLFEKYNVNIKDFKYFKCFDKDLIDTNQENDITKLNQYDSSLKISDLYLYLSFSLNTNSEINEKIKKYINNESKHTFLKKKFKMNDIKKIVIIDDIYSINKLIKNYLVNLISGCNDHNIVFILITKNLSDIHPLIQSRCLTFYSKPFEATPEYLISKYPDLKESTVKRINKYFSSMSTDGLNNSLCLIDTFIRYIDKYKTDDDLNVCILKMLQNDIIHDKKISFIQELLKICLYSNESLENTKIKAMKIIKEMYRNGLYAEYILNITLSYIINSVLSDDDKVIFIEELVKSIYIINKYSESYFQVNNCFLNIIDRIYSDK